MSSFLTFEMIYHQRQLRGYQIHSLKSQNHKPQKQIYEENLQTFLSPESRGVRRTLKRFFIQSFRALVLFYNFLPFILVKILYFILPFQFVREL